MDRPLGALTRLAAPLVAPLVVLGAVATAGLTPPAAGARATGAPADDEPGPALAGTPVSGTARPSRAPALATGRYLDRLPARGDLHYRLPRTATGSTFHVAVMFLGADDSVGEGVRLQAGTTPGDQGCGSGGVFRPTLGEPEPVIFAGLTTWTDGEDHPCALATELYLTVGAPDEPADAGREMELLVFEEPPLSSFHLDLLPAPEPVAWTAQRPAPRPREVPAGTTPTNAPVVGDGSYALTLRPGRTQVLAVPLDWDQTLQAQLDARVPAGAPAPEGIAVDVLSPLLGTSERPFTQDRPADWRVPGAGGGRLRTGAQSQVVSYANRDSYDASVTTEALAGIHYVMVRWTGTSGRAGSPAGADTEVAATLSLRTLGEPGDGVPAYTPVEGLVGPQAASRLVDGTLSAPAPAEPAASTPEDDGPAVSRRTLVVGGVVGGVAAGLLLVLARLRRHSRGHPHAGTARPLAHHEPGGRHRG